MELIECICCNNEVFIESDNCRLCDFPFSGSEVEKSKHIGKFIVNKRIISSSEDSLENNQYLLCFISAITFLSAIIMFTNSNGFVIETLMNFAIGIVILLCGFFLKKRPILLTIIPLFLILGIYLLNYILDPSTLIKGIVFKVIIISSLIYNVFLIQKSNSFKKNNNL
jgi:hypothetical protein